MPVLKERALIFPLRPLQDEMLHRLANVPEWGFFGRGVIKASTHQAAPLTSSQNLSAALPAGRAARGFPPKHGSPTAQGTLRERYLSKTFSSQLRLMSTQRGTFTRMPRSSSSRS